MKKLLIVLLLAAGGQLSAEFPARYEEALALYEKGDYEKSLEVVRAIFDANKNSYEVRMLAAANHARTGNINNAIAHLQYVVQDHPDKMDGRLFLASLYRKTGRAGYGAEILRPALVKDPENQAFLLEMARLLYHSGQLPAARKITERLIQKDRNHFDAVTLDGLIFLRQGNFENADFRFRHAMTLQAPDARAAGELYNNAGVAAEKGGDVLLAQGKKKEAQARYAEASGLFEKAIKGGVTGAEKNRERASRKQREAA